MEENLRISIKKMKEYFANNSSEFSIGLQNFQSIREFTIVPLAQLTLIYGQNSAGKSAINDALRFISNFLYIAEHDDAHAESNKAIQEYLPRWASRQRLTKKLTNYIDSPEDVVIRITGYTKYSSTMLLNEKLRRPGKVLYDLWDDINAKFTIQFNFNNTPSGLWEVTKFSLFVGDDELLSYKLFPREIVKNNEYCTDRLDIKDRTVKVKKWTNKMIPDGFVLYKNHPLFDVIGCLFDKNIEDWAKESAAYNGFTNFNDKWINLEDVWFEGAALEWSFNYSFFSGNHEQYNNYSFLLAEDFRCLIHALVISFFECAARHVKLLTVPPLRDVPSKKKSKYRFNGPEQYFHDEENMAWRLLAKQIELKECREFWEILTNNCIKNENISANPREQLTIDYVNHVLSHPMFLNTGYKVIGDSKFIISKDILNDARINDFDYFREIVESEVDLKLKFIPDDFEVDIEDVGVGISQIIPVLCAIDNEFYSTYIHQPELHLHPKQQSHLGDIFIERINYQTSIKSEMGFSFSRHLIIETHSEHILLRILRRIKETLNSDIKSNLYNILSDQVSVIYVDKNELGESKIKQLRISDSGEFLDRWPHGFFTERDEDLFYE